jgi:hypothetical protein
MNSEEELQVSRLRKSNALYAQPTVYYQQVGSSCISARTGRKLWTNRIDTATSDGVDFGSYKAFAPRWVGGAMGVSDDVP